MNLTSSDWLIERNKLVQNKKAIRIAANQNHGVRPLKEELSSILPQNHKIENNEIRENVIGIELEKAEGVQISGNALENLLTNVHEK